MTLREQFLKLREECIWLQICFNTFKVLFEDSKTRPLLERTAPRFFEDLNRILQEYCYLQICKITDPAKTAGKENLTVEALNVELEKVDLLTNEIQQLSSSMMRYRSLIKDARDRLISHLDKMSVGAGAVLGAHNAGEVASFFDAMQAYCDAVGNAVGEGPLDFQSTHGPGDVIDLVRALRQASRGP